MVNPIGKVKYSNWIEIYGNGLQTQMYMDFMDAYGLDYPYPNKVIASKQKDLDLNQSLVIRFNKFMVV